MNATTNRRSPIRTIVVDVDLRTHRITAIPMTDLDLQAAADDIEALDLPQDRTGLMPLKGFHLYSEAGDHFGRVYSRAGVMTAEWYDDAVQQDWVMAMWDCHRLERAVIEILRLRDEVLRPLAAASKRHAAEQRQAAHKENLAYLATRGLTLDQEGFEVTLQEVRQAAAA